MATMKAMVLALGLAAVLAGVVGLSLALFSNGAQAQGQAGPAAPANVGADNGVVPGQALVWWDAVADAAYYRIGWVNMETFRAVQAEGEREWLDVFAFRDVVNRGQTAQIEVLYDLAPGVEYAFIAASVEQRFGSASGWSDWAYLITAAAASCPTNTGTTPEAPGGIGAPTPTPAPWATPAATATPTAWPTPTPTATATPQPTPTSTGNVFDPTPTPTPTAWPTPTPAPTPTAWPTPTPAPTPTAWPTPTATPAPTPTRPRAANSVGGDRAALVASYEAANGANWNYNGDWLSDAPINQWNSVNTDSSGRVTHLEANRDLRGAIPAELDNISKLGTLYRDANGLTGAMPAELGRFAKLKSLYLGGNKLTGCIPAGLPDVTANDLGGLGLSACN